MINKKWRDRIGGMWDIIGPLQIDFLVKQGLQPQHYLLDIGCGCLRGGVHFAKFLEDGHYYGVDKNQELLERGMDELKAIDIDPKVVHLMQNGEFLFEDFDQSFDYAIAQSVFTHLPLNSILRCLYELKKVLKPSGKFFATFFHDSKGDHISSKIKHTPGNITTFSDRDPYHYHLGSFEHIAERVGLNVDFMGEWNHPRNQQMLLFTHH